IIKNSNPHFYIENLFSAKPYNSVLQSNKSIAGPWRNDFLEIAIGPKSKWFEYWKDYWIVDRLVLEDKESNSKKFIFFLIPRKVLFEAKFIDNENVDLKEAFFKYNSGYSNFKKTKVYANLKSGEITIKNFELGAAKDWKELPGLYINIHKLTIHMNSDPKTIEMDFSLKYSKSKERQQKIEGFEDDYIFEYKYIFKE
ncbi:hypothetical protein, partial [Metamycoplasma hominis]